MKIVIFGLTITSAWGNGHATAFRSLIKALAIRGHSVLFIEKDAEWYRNNRDLPNPSFCSVIVYEDWIGSETYLLAQCADADAIVIGSYFPDAIAAATALVNAGTGPLLFYDIDTPITMTSLRAHGRTDYLEADMISCFDAYLSFTGGPMLRELVTRFGARLALPFYCSVDPDLYLPTTVRPEFRCDLSYLGTHASDRQPKLMRLLNQPAELLPEHSFIVAGAMYPEDTVWAPNVARIMHVSPPDHPTFYSSARFTLNLTRRDMATAGYSPSVRLFEASACSAAILSDDWEGLDHFLSPGEQILLMRDEQDVTDILLHLSEEERLRIGRLARERILAEHTSAHRAVQFEEIVGGLGDRLSINRRAVPESRGISPDSSPEVGDASKLLSPTR
jgi:spore maturation protein CgeB